MPDYAELIVDKVTCPVCRKLTLILGGVVKFQWGKIPHRYKMNDAIVWLIDKQQQIIPPFKILKQKRLFGGLRLQWNCGESAYRNLYVADTDLNIDTFSCSECGIIIDKLVVQIQDGKIIEVHALHHSSSQTKLGIALEQSDIVIIHDDQNLWARDDWNDHPLDYL